jgi:putative DNA modification/repair radical SAM protein
MDVQNKLRILADAAKYDASCASSGSQRQRQSGGIGNGASCGICHSYTPDGRCVSLLKILLTNYCIYDCRYCVNRVSSDTPRARFMPEEVAALTMEFYKRNYIEGLFLSSGVVQSPDHTMEQMIAAARLLRTEHVFGGYIHLKTVPGASKELLAEAGLYADRLSANIELPLQADLDALAPAKNHREIESAMATMQSCIAESRETTRTYAAAGQSTQMIVGATATPDGQILTRASRLYDDYKLRRVYYSGFNPIPHADPRLPASRAPLVREHRLYQADWLLRFYGFSVDELIDADSNLPLDRDPKLDWALRNRDFFPVDVNAASREALLRVPGFGVRNVDRMLRSRRWHQLTLDDLRRLRVPLRKAGPFILTATMNPAARQIDSVRLPLVVAAPGQLALFEAAQTARTGEL